MSRLLAILDEAAAASDGVARRERGESVDYEVDGTLVATVGPMGAEFRLGPEVAEAALRTPDAHASPRGPDWVAFRPRTIDRFAADRAEAWFGLAVRLSPGPGTPRSSPAR